MARGRCKHAKLILTGVEENWGIGGIGELEYGDLEEMRNWRFGELGYGNLEETGKWRNRQIWKKQGFGRNRDLDEMEKMGEMEEMDEMDEMEEMEL